MATKWFEVDLGIKGSAVFVIKARTPKAALGQAGRYFHGLCGPQEVVRVPYVRESPSGGWPTLEALKEVLQNPRTGEVFHVFCPELNLSHLEAADDDKG